MTLETVITADRAVRRLIEVVEQELDADVQLLGPLSAPSAPSGGRLVALREDAGALRGWMRLIPRGEPLADTSDRVIRLLVGLLGASDAEGHPAAVEQRVEQVLDGADLSIVYQPIRDLFTGQTVGYEALSRFPSPPVQPPDRWFADAASLGLGVPLEVLAVRLAVGALDALPGDVYLSVNVSPAVAMSHELVTVLDGVDVSRLVLEITEHAEVDDYEGLNRAIGLLRARGARLAIDDTGSGFASMRHVLRLAPDVVKLDTTLTHDIDRDSTLRALGYSLKSFASAIDAEVVAEGVETEREMDALRFLGVRYGQGYHLRPPGPLVADDLAGVSPTSAG